MAGWPPAPAADAMATNRPARGLGARQQRGDGGLRGPPHAGQVDVDVDVPHVVGRLPRRVAAGDHTGAGDGGVEPSEPLGRRGRPRRRARPGPARRPRPRSAWSPHLATTSSSSARVASGYGSAAIVVAAVERDDRVAVGGEAAGDRRADAAGCARHERDAGDLGRIAHRRQPATERRARSTICPNSAAPSDGRRGRRVTEHAVGRHRRDAVGGHDRRRSRATDAGRPARRAPCRPRPGRGAAGSTSRCARRGRRRPRRCTGPTTRDEPRRAAARRPAPSAAPLPPCALSSTTPSNASAERTSSMTTSSSPSCPIDRVPTKPTGAPPTPRWRSRGATTNRSSPDASASATATAMRVSVSSGR